MNIETWTGLTPHALTTRSAYRFCSGVMVLLPWYHVATWSALLISHSKMTSSCSITVWSSSGRRNSIASSVDAVTDHTSAQRQQLLINPRISMGYIVSAWTIRPGLLTFYGQLSSTFDVFNLDTDRRCIVQLALVHRQEVTFIFRFHFNAVRLFQFNTIFEPF